MKIQVVGLMIVTGTVAVGQAPRQQPNALPPPGGSIVGAEGNPLSNRRVGPPGPVPRMENGKPNLSGVWYSPRAVDPRPPKMTAWAAEITKNRNPKDDPEAHCLPAGVPRMNPFPWKIVQTSDLLVMLFEGNIHSYRQVFLDGRDHPKDLDPTWYGHSIGKWDGDSLVVDTIGFNDKFWFDPAGHPHTEKLHVIERYHRRDLGNLDIDITIIDPDAYTEPWQIKRASVLMNGEIQEYICNENNQDVEHLVGR